MIQRRVDRSPNNFAASLFEPVFCFRKEPTGNIFVVDTIKEAEEADTVIVPVKVSSVQNGTNSPNGAFSFGCNEGLTFIGLVKRVFVPQKAEPNQPVLFNAELRNPVGIIFIDFPRKIEKRLLLRPSFGRNDLHKGGLSAIPERLSILASVSR
jgi:hypothetical protein